MRKSPMGQIIILAHPATGKLYEELVTVRVLFKRSSPTKRPPLLERMKAELTDKEVLLVKKQRHAIVNQGIMYNCVTSDTTQEDWEDFMNTYDKDGVYYQEVCACSIAEWEKKATKKEFSHHWANHYINY